MNFGSQLTEFFNSLSEKKLIDIYLDASYRQISGCKDFQDLIRKIKLEKPDEEWIKRNEPKKLRTENPQAYKLIREYVSCSKVNFELRQNPSAEARINDVIRQTEPLQSDIVVYRCLHGQMYSSLQIGDTVVVHGYLSTTFTPRKQFSTGKIPDGRDIDCVLKIKVPKGTRVLYTGQWKDELIFPHLTQMTLLNRELQVFLVSEEIFSFRLVEYFEFQLK